MTYTFKQYFRVQFYGTITYKNGFVYLFCTMCMGEMTVTLATELYLRARTVRAINRRRAAGE